MFGQGNIWIWFPLIDGFAATLPAIPKLKSNWVAVSNNPCPTFKDLVST